MHINQAFFLSHAISAPLFRDHLHVAIQATDVHFARGPDAHPARRANVLSRGALFLAGARISCAAAAVAANLIAAPMAMAMTHEDDAHDRGRADSMAGLVGEVRSATQRFLDPTDATAAGYVSTGSCVSGPEQGAMGVHYVNEAFIADGILDVQRPEVLVYEQRNGRLRLAAVEFFVDAQQWDAANPGPPVLLGQHFHYVGAPNRLRMPAYYELHVWAWKRNPNGVFSDWNPDVSCVEYKGEPGGDSGH